MGFGDAFVLVDYAIVRSRLSAWQRASLFLKRYVKRHYLQYADEYVVETSAARDALGNVVNVSPDRIHVIANAIAPQFSSVSPPKFDLSPNPLEVLAIAAPYAHKNLEIIPEVLRELSQRTARQFIFRLTLPSDHPLTLRIFKRAKDLNVDSLIRNDGPVTFKQLPEAFIRCGIVFHPSLLETFSATYLEAMAMGRPILASDLPFAREVCGDAALYFSPMSPTDAAMKLIALVTDHSLPTKLVDEGYRRVKAFPNSIQRFRLQQALIRGCVERSAAHSRAT
jgi:glycosyltransferase involved in cell wall biosynthesis